MGLFYNRSATAEDKIRVSMYKQQAMRGSYKKQFENLEDYLISLEMEMIVFNDDKKLIPRIAQMSQKTNQFNLTTKRYTEGDINRLVGDHNALVMAISITDKYGDSGVTGLCIVKIDRQKGVSEIDTFLLSCRIIGRNIEFVFIDTVVNRLKSEGVITIVAKYIKTNKNQQVMDFYDDCSFKFISFDDSKRYYKLHISDYKPHDINYIKVSYGKTD